MAAYLICEFVDRRNLFLLCSNGSVKVFMLFEQRLNAVTRSVDAVLQRRLTSCHPRLGLLTVAVEQLQFQTLIKLGTSSNPRPATQQLNNLLFMLTTLHSSK